MLNAHFDTIAQVLKSDQLDSTLNRAAQLIELLGQEAFGFGLLLKEKIAICALQAVEIESEKTPSTGIEVGDLTLMAGLQKGFDAFSLFE